MNIIAIIPARLASSRLPKKVLADIHGHPMIEHVYRRAKTCRHLSDVIIAADDEEIILAAKKFGADARLTRVDHSSGSDRIAEVAAQLECDVVINIQGDEPLLSPSSIDALAQAMVANPECLMATLIKPLESTKEFHDPNVVKVVVDANKNALYFSRAIIPYHRASGGGTLVESVAFKHIGVYAYRRDFLLKFVALPKSTLESIEQLEQLRVLEAGYKIKTVLTDQDAISVDTHEDLERVRTWIKILKEKTLDASQTTKLSDLSGFVGGVDSYFGGTFGDLFGN